MSHYVTVSEYAEIKDVHRQTIYRWAKNGNIDVKEINGVMHVKVDSDSDSDDVTDVTNETLMQQNKHLKEDVEYLRDRLKQAQETIDNMQKRHDTIVLQLTNQLAVLFTSRSVQKTLALEDKSRLIEDMRNKSIWRRLKTALGFAAS